VGLSGNSWASLLNPAAAGTVTIRTLGFAHEPSPFELTELRRSTFLYCEPTSLGSFTLSGSSYGFVLYRELTFGLSFGCSLGPALRGGVAIACYIARAEGYGAATTVGVDLGFQYDLADDVCMGVSISNLNAPVIGRAREILPQVFSAGCAYRPLAGLAIRADIEKDIRFPLEVRCGIEYVPVEPVSIRGGMGRDPAFFTCGVGISVDRVTIDYSMTGHDRLGWSQQVGLTLHLGGE
jgi:hypothetical protein